MFVIGYSVYIYLKKNKILVANFTSLPYSKYLRDRLISNTYRRYHLGKRKTGELRREQRHHQKYQAHTTETINFNQENLKRNRKPIELLPQTINQEKYILSLVDKDTDIVVVSGPAGTGKTYLAMLAAIKSLRKGDIDRIILTRPAVAVDDEKHGFLPGDLNSKMEPWIRPLLDVLKEHYGMKEIKYMFDEQIIEITPLAFCRGRNFKNSWVILDESQNTTISQMTMMLTRIGAGSKIVVTGDIEQSDRQTRDNGLLDLKYRLTNNPIKGIALCEFDSRDIRRHKIIGDILKLYR